MHTAACFHVIHEVAYNVRVQERQADGEIHFYPEASNNR